MKNFALSFLCIVLTYSGSLEAQVSVQANYIKPSGVLGRVFKPTIGLEIGYELSDQESQFKLAVAIGIFRFVTVEDTLSSYAIEHSGTTTLLPGYEVYENYFSIPIGVLIEYQFLDKKLSPVIATDLYAHINSYTHYYHVDTFISSQETTGDLGLGFCPRVGLRFKLSEDIHISTGLAKNISLVIGSGIQSYWKVSLGAKYYF